ncbi:uncharacterized protein [Palaemon carinicauda]|uniref:uncharacterized protein n=1 Tax=Palaemon carinicauda TaxID=392227 RepID=UPI0035B61370
MISSPKGNYNDRFNFGATLKMVPVFDEKSVPEFFKDLERVATRLSWPSEIWTVLIQCRLVDKAIRVYNALEEGIARDYQKVKALVLKAYDLVPEADRLKFRNDNKHPSQSCVEFARVKENQFNDWIKSRQVVSFASLREMLLLEEFKKACSKELRVHLEEVKVVKVSNAAQLTDEYVLTHRSGASSFSYPGRTDPSSRVFNNVNRVEPSSPMSKNNANSFSGGNKGGISGGPPPQSSFGNRSMSISNTPNKYNNPGSGRQRTCFGVTNLDTSRTRYLERNGQNPVSLISTSSDVCDKGENPPIVSSSVDSSINPSASPKVACLNFDKYIWPGKIILESGHINVKFLRDSGSARSLVLGTSLSGLKAYSGNYVVLGGFPNTVVSAPLVEVRLSFQGYDGVTELAVVENLSIHGIDGILGNDMLNREGRELFPILSVEAYPVSVTTRASARAAELGKDDDLLLSSLEVDVERPGGECAELAIRHITSVPYHPESQGVVERFHQTFKSILKKSCYAHGSEWDKELPLALFAIRNHPNASTGVAPFDLIFGHKVRGPLDIFL